MAKKKSLRARKAGPNIADHGEAPKVVVAFNEYFGPGNLENWQRLMKDLGFEEEFPSKTKCYKALEDIWVNIPDFLTAVQRGEKPHLFDSQSELAQYTKKTKKFYPKSQIPKKTPLRRLLVHMNRPGLPAQPAETSSGGSDFWGTGAQAIQDTNVKAAEVTKDTNVAGKDSDAPVSEASNDEVEIITEAIQKTGI